MVYTVIKNSILNLQSYLVFDKPKYTFPYRHTIRKSFRYVQFAIMCENFLKTHEILKNMLGSTTSNIYFKRRLHQFKLDN